MKMPDNYSKEKPNQGPTYQKPPAGGYTLICKGVEEKVSKSGNDMLVLSLDIATGDFKGAFDKYPIKYYQLTTPEQIGRYKGVIKSFSESNDRFPAESFGDSEHTTSKLVGLMVGGVLREEEYMNASGEVKSGMKAMYLCSSDTAMVATPPKKKFLESTNPTTNPTTNQEDLNSLPF